VEASANAPAGTGDIGWIFNASAAIGCPAGSVRVAMTIGTGLAAIVCCTGAGRGVLRPSIQA